MSTLNPIKLWVNLFRRNAFFSVLRMTSRLLFIAVFFGAFFVLQPLGFKVNSGAVFLIAYFSMVFLDVFFFEILRLEESRFKDERAFFRKHRFSPKRIDAHARFITRLKASSLILVPLLAGFVGGPAGGLTLFLMMALPIYSADRYFRKVVRKQPFVKRYKAWADKHTDHHWRPNSSIGIDVRSNNTTSTLPPNFGVSGYNIAGIYTGSSTAVGGISS